jgi:type II secretory pathway pseudopilin PulG
MPSADHRRRRAAAFTLTELMIAATLGAVILAGVVSALLMIERTAYRASQYSEEDAEVRRGLETFAEDVRQAVNVQWTSSQCITLAVPTATDATRLVTYAYDADPASGTYQSFYCMSGPAGSGAPRQVLVRGVAPDFAFQRYKLDQPGVADDIATNDMETKQIQVTLRVVRTGATTVAATQNAVSARFLLRNKRVSG